MKHNDWDILILLDACRYDYFKKYNPYQGKLYKYNQGCNGTKKYFQMNINDTNFKDTILINHIILLPEWVNPNYFHKVVDVYKAYWDNDYGVVLPEDNTMAAMEQIKKYPNKRFIIHYAQPHIPFLNQPPNLTKQKTQKEVAYQNELTGKIMLKVNSLKNIFPPIPFWYCEKLLGNSAGIGEIFFKDGWDGLKKAYTENLLRALDSIKPIVDLDKKIIITSDHGKIIGEHLNLFSHGWYRFSEVVEVPWLEVE